MDPAFSDRECASCGCRPTRVRDPVARVRKERRNHADKVWSVHFSRRVDFRGACQRAGSESQSARRQSKPEPVGAAAVAGDPGAGASAGFHSIGAAESVRLAGDESSRKSGEPGHGHGCAAAGGPGSASVGGQSARGAGVDDDHSEEEHEDEEDPGPDAEEGGREPAG